LTPRGTARLLQGATHQIHARQPAEICGRSGVPFVVVRHGCTIETRPLSSSCIVISILRASQSAGMSW
jgi:hypothetical protein